MLNSHILKIPHPPLGIVKNFCLFALTEALSQSYSKSSIVSHMDASIIIIVENIVNTYPNAERLNRRNRQEQSQNQQNRLHSSWSKIIRRTSNRDIRPYGEPGFIYMSSCTGETNFLRYMYISELLNCDDINIIKGLRHIICILTSLHQLLIWESRHSISFNDGLLLIKPKHTNSIAVIDLCKSKTIIKYSNFKIYDERIYLDLQSHFKHFSAYYIVKIS